MEHADRILTGFLPSLYYVDLLVGAGIAAVVKILVWQKQADAKKLRKGVEYGSARWGTAEDIKPFMADDFWMNIPLTATESITMESRPKNPKFARNKNICVIGGSGSGKNKVFRKGLYYDDELFHGHHRPEGNTDRRMREDVSQRTAKERQAWKCCER